MMAERSNEKCESVGSDKPVYRGIRAAFLKQCLALVRAQEAGKLTREAVAYQIAGAQGEPEIVRDPVLKAIAELATDLETAEGTSDRGTDAAWLGLAKLIEGCDYE